jgi:hypothetical protein
MNYKKFPPYKSKIPKAKDLSSLALADLKKVRRSFSAYLAKKAAYDAELQRIDLDNRETATRNERIRQSEQEWDSRCLSPLYAKKGAIEGKLKQSAVGMLGGFVFDLVEFRGQRYRRNPGAELVRSLLACEKEISDCLAGKPSFNLKAREPWPKLPKGETNLKIGGATIKIAFSELDAEALDALVAQKEDQVKQDELKFIDLQARAAATEKEVRKQAQKKSCRDLHKQLSLVPVCPYCAGVLDDTNARLDHVYPVSKGGKSATKNLVFVCLQCNQDKSNLTLRSFLIRFSKMETDVYKRLEILGKDF